MNVDDILFVLFRHKWKILLCAALGIAAAASVYLYKQRLYQSEAKLMVRYVVDSSAVDTLDSQPKGSDASQINSEVQILTSWDLAMQVASAVGVERLLPESEGKATLAAAANIVREGLTVVSPKYTNIIVLSYKNPNPELATLVLKELVARYFTKHLEVHRSGDAFDFVTQQSDQVKARLNQTEEELKQLKGKTGIVSLAENTLLINGELANTQDALQTAQAEYAEQQARVQAMDKSLEPKKEGAPETEPPPIDRDAVRRYEALLAQLERLRQVQMDLLAKYGEKAAQPEVPDELQRSQQVRAQQRADNGRIRIWQRRVAPCVSALWALKETWRRQWRASDTVVKTIQASLTRSAKRVLIHS